MNIPIKFGVWGNIEKDAFWEILPKIIKWAKSKNIESYLTEKILLDDRAGRFDQPIIDSAEIISEMDFMLVLGGDGTFLSCARAIEHRSTPILGIHLGDLGFLAKVTLEDIFQRLDQVAKGEYLIEKRSMVKAVVEKNGSSLTQYGLNDFVVSNGESHRMLIAEVYVDGNRVSEYKADGLIVATPTGSTAYSLSAGGPIIHPSLDVWTILPMLPQSLSSRPFIISSDENVEMELFEGPNDSAKICVDGQDDIDVSYGVKISISKMKKTLKLVHPEDNDFFEACREKLGWSLNISKS